MERYHILKLGLAITFYAAYCIRPMLVYSLEADNELDNNPNVPNPDHEYFQYLHGVEGRPGVDFPIYSYIPRTTFNCRGIESGYYADLDTDCQVFHICEEGRKISFLCPNGTIFQQSELICEWWNKVNCSNSPSLYEESAERLQNDIARRKASRRVSLNGGESSHGAIMRMEERSSVRASKNGRDYPVRQDNNRQQRIKNHRIPDNNDIEQQLEQESNNRHLANAQNSLPTSQKSSFSNQRYQNHNYNGVDQSNNQPNSLRQTKKDVDGTVGNYGNKNFDQSSTRHSKKVDQGAKNTYDFALKSNEGKSSTLKEYHVQFASTQSGFATESYTPSQTNFKSTQQYTGSSRSSSNQQDFTRSNSRSTFSYSSQSTVAPNTFQASYNTEQFGTRTTSKLPQTIFSYSSQSTASPNSLRTVYNNEQFGAKTTSKFSPTTFNKARLFNTEPPSTTASSTTKTSTTSAPIQQTTPPEFAYGTGIKGKFNSFDARLPKTSQLNDKPSQNNYRESIRYNANSNYVNAQQTSKYSIPITTYSPPVKYTTYRPQENNKDDNDELPPFPKHKSELVQDESYVKKPISTTFARPRLANGGQIPVNIGQIDNNQQSGESQVPEESSSFVKNSFNSITDDFKTSVSPYPNHRSTYSDLKDLRYLEAPKLSAISSITPHLVTTQPINNGKPFVGSRIGNTLLPNQPTTQSKYTYLPTSTASSKPTIIFGVLRHSTTTELPPYGPLEAVNTNKSIADLFNTGSTDKTLPPIETSTPITNPIPTELFNIGNTDSTLPANVVMPNSVSTAVPPFKIYVPEQGSLNVGQSDANTYKGTEPVNEPPFIKKNVPLLYNSTESTIDHATVYGAYANTEKPKASSRNTPYSPTVPSVTPSTANEISSRAPKTFSQRVPVRFDKGQDKISVHLSKNIGGQTTNNLQKYNGAGQQSLLKVGAIVRVSDAAAAEPVGVSSGATSSPNGFFVTRGFNKGNTKVKSKTEKPRPFSKSLEFGARLNTEDPDDNGLNTVPITFPSYHISSARPFGISDTTSPTPSFTTQAPSQFNIYDNVDNMIGVLQEIANYNNAQKEFAEDPRPGLIIPPSVSPQTLHSLAQYFANELQKNESDHEVFQPETKEKLNSLLTAMTVHGYDNLFNVGFTSTPSEATTSSLGLQTTTVLTPSRFGNEDTAKATTTDGADHSGSDDDLLTTTSLPELRQLARNFSLALSSYLNDPDNFRKNLEGLRPTEPPPLDGSDNAESSTSEDELLNFSDADVKPSTPANPSPTWGYILAAEAAKGAQDDVKNSLNPDLNTADSQSFVPRFNNVQVDEKQGKGFTDLPPNHWTSSPQATKLWQKALSVNPAVVNDHFETTPAGIHLIDEETTEPELFNPDVLPSLTGPQSEIRYDLRELPPLRLNSTQVHGILIDFMNHTKLDEDNRLNRILKKLNTSEEEFLDRMKEIESNPLTKRLILLLISECGANITQDLGLGASTHHGRNSKENEDSLVASASTAAPLFIGNIQPRHTDNQALDKLVHPHLTEEEQDTRALQLLNSLYTIAAKFGKKR